MKFNFKKKFGQNFLQDSKVIDKIINSLSVCEKDLIIEIGPGSGALTKRLVKKDASFIAYEIDEELKDCLSIYEGDKTKVIYDDFLKRNIKEDIEKISYGRLFVIGNLPYYITTPIITKIIDDKIFPEEMIFMVQKEVALRFTANVGTRDYGAITVFLNYYFEVNLEFIVNRDKFYPVPNVDSAVIKFKRRNSLLDVDFSRFNKFVKDAFTFKRKNLRNNLRSYDQDKLGLILNKLNKSLENRAEDLSYEDFVYLTNEYYR